MAVLGGVLGPRGEPAPQGPVSWALGGGRPILRAHFPLARPTRLPPHSRALQKVGLGGPEHRDAGVGSEGPAPTLCDLERLQWPQLPLQGPGVAVGAAAQGRHSPACAPEPPARGLSSGPRRGAQVQGRGRQAAGPPEGLRGWAPLAPGLWPVSCRKGDRAALACGREGLRRPVCGPAAPTRDESMRRAAPLPTSGPPWAWLPRPGPEPAGSERHSLGALPPCRPWVRGGAGAWRGFPGETAWCPQAAPPGGSARPPPVPSQRDAGEPREGAGQAWLPPPPNLHGASQRSDRKTPGKGAGPRGGVHPPGAAEAQRQRPPPPGEGQQRDSRVRGAQPHPQGPRGVCSQPWVPACTPGPAPPVCRAPPPPVCRARPPRPKAATPPKGPPRWVEEGSSM